MLCMIHAKIQFLQMNLFVYYFIIFRPRIFTKSRNIQVSTTTRNIGSILWRIANCIIVICPRDVIVLLTYVLAPTSKHDCLWLCPTKPTQEANITSKHRGAGQALATGRRSFSRHCSWEETKAHLGGGLDLSRFPRSCGRIRRTCVRVAAYLPLVNKSV